MYITLFQTFTLVHIFVIQISLKKNIHGSVIFSFFVFLKNKLFFFFFNLFLVYFCDFVWLINGNGLFCVNRSPVQPYFSFSIVYNFMYFMHFRYCCTVNLLYPVKFHGCAVFFYVLMTASLISFVHFRHCWTACLLHPGFFF